MSEREKALEAAATLEQIRGILADAISRTEEDLCDDYDDADYTGERPDLYDYEVTISLNFARAVFAALAMPATVDGADFLRGWKAGRDAADMAVAKLEYGEADDSSYDAGRLYGLGLARAAIRSLTPPEDDP
jgi:hypothetical protein